MSGYLEEILKKADEVSASSFNTKELRERFQNLTMRKRFFFNKRIKEELFDDIFWLDCTADYVLKKIYSIFDEAENYVVNEK